MATAVINGIVVTGSVEEIHQLILKATTGIRVTGNNGLTAPGNTVMIGV